MGVQILIDFAVDILAELEHLRRYRLDDGVCLLISLIPISQRK